MNSDKNCQSCSESDKCSAVYEKLGKAQGPSVVKKVVLAFLLPIIIFIVILAISGFYLKNIFTNEDISTAIGALIALIVVFVYICVVRLFINDHKNSNCPEQIKEK